MGALCPLVMLPRLHAHAVVESMKSIRVYPAGADVEVANARIGVITRRGFELGIINVMDRVKGDQTIGWDENNPDEIEQAQATFDSLRAKGYLAYRVTKEGTKTGEQIKKFDPALKRIILAPPLVGG